MKVTIETIPHQKHRYPTVGDWFFNENNDLTICVSEMNSWKSEMLVALHEMVEALLCFDRGVSEKDVTEFDVEFEKRRPSGNVDEPGDDSSAPYRNEHFFATTIERLMSAELNIDWTEYDRTINNL